MGLAGRQLLNDADFCQVAIRWRITSELALGLVRLAERFESSTGNHLWIISGGRSVAKQLALIDAGVGAPVELSTHLSCPSTGADVFPFGLHPTTNVRAFLGAAALQSGLRWGGGSSRDANGLPSDWNHFDLGPRTDRVAEDFRATL